MHCHRGLFQRLRSRRHGGSMPADCPFQRSSRQATSRLVSPARPSRPEIASEILSGCVRSFLIIVPSVAFGLFGSTTACAAASTALIASEYERTGSGSAVCAHSHAFRRCLSADPDRSAISALLTASANASSPMTSDQRSNPLPSARIRSTGESSSSSPSTFRPGSKAGLKDSGSMNPTCRCSTASTISGAARWACHKL